MTNPSDIELWNAFVRGDSDAFGQLFRLHYAPLFQYGSKICPDRTVLEDAIQELFAEVWQRKPQAPLSVRAYLLQALKFKLYRAYRSTRTVRIVQPGNEELFELSHEHFMVAAAEDEERKRKVFEVLNSLPARQREIIYLRIYKGLSYEDVSQIMNLNYQVVRNLLCQALKTFRRLMMPVLAVLVSLHHISFVQS